MSNCIRRRLLGPAQTAPRLLRAVFLGTALAFLISLFRPLFKPAAELARPYLLPLPPHTVAQATAAALSLLAIALLLRLPLKVWRSVELGLIPVTSWVWAASVAAFWLAYELHQAVLAWTALVFAGLVSIAADLTSRIPRKPRRCRPRFSSPICPFLRAVRTCSAAARWLRIW